MSLLKRRHITSSQDSAEMYDDEHIDPELRLRTVRTAHSAIAESIVADTRQTRRRRRFWSSRGEKNRHGHGEDPVKEKQEGRGTAGGEAAECVFRTTKYTILTFIPRNLYEQFRRIANLFFLTLVVFQHFVVVVSNSDQIYAPREERECVAYPARGPAPHYPTIFALTSCRLIAFLSWRLDSPMVYSPVFGAASGATAVLPLAFIITVTAIKDGVEDYRRGRLDEEVNNSPTTRLAIRNPNIPRDPRSLFEKIFGLNRPGSVSKGVKKLRATEAAGGLSGPSQSTLNVDDTDTRSMASASTGAHSGSARYGRSSRWGDLVLLRDNEQVPADIIVLATSDPDGNCYLETKNLDGETNLKLRKSLGATRGMSCAEEEVQRARFVLDSEAPSQNLYLYHGVLRYRDFSVNSAFSSVHARANNNNANYEADFHGQQPRDVRGGSTPPEDRAEPVSINEMLLRGCALRNTAWVVGLVVFTGADTKIMLNGGETPSKRSKIERETNFNVAVNFGVLVMMCVVAAIFSGLEDAKSNTSADFFEIDTDPTSVYVLNALVTFVSCVIMFQNIVPISLYISIEIVKTIQAYFISQDVDMYYEGYDTPCVPKTWNISDDLGQIEYVFSDKTGTLTQNVMEFQKCSVNGIAYGEGVTEAQRGAATRAGQVDTMDPQELSAKLAGLKQLMVTTMERAWSNRYLQPNKLTLVSPALASALADRGGSERPHLVEFFRALALCHSVLAEKHGGGSGDDKSAVRVEYKAESPDEAALVGAARDVGFVFVNKGREMTEIQVLGETERWTLLRVLEFNSTRKRMSTVYRAPDGRLVMYCKGADSVMYARLAPNHDPVLKEATRKDMEAFANNGLRTLCVAWRVLSQEEYTRWGRIYDEATNRVEGRDEAIEAACEQLEQNFTILGATALEDKLQEGVPEAIETLHQAGIKLWILTGDKLQTAIEIGYSCNLLKNDMDLMILSADSQQAARAQIEAGLNKIASVLGPPSMDIRKRGFVPGAQASFAVVIDGDTLSHALSPELKEMFLNLGTQCETVVCCRVSPAQKALTVKLVKDGRNAMTLSIGDGANDVAMIQEANIGCGLIGLEGSQAAMSADYAFGQFRFLTKLLIVHGRWSYQRVADMHANFFYKNVIWTFGLFWYLPFSGFDATYLYHYTFILLCNLVFTSLPVIVMGAFDQDLNARAALAFPQLYVRGIRGLEYTRTKFWLYMLDGLYQSAVVFFIPYLVWSLGLAVSWNGKGIDSLSDFGTTVAVSAILTANAYVGLNMNYWTSLTWIVVFGSTIVMMAWIVIFSFFFSADFINEEQVLFGELTFWTTVVVTSLICLAPRFIIKYYSTVYSPLDKDIVREMWVMGDLKDQLGIPHHNGKRRRGARSIIQEPSETAPMFSTDHARSVSEFNQYEPANTSSPGTTTAGIPLSSMQPYSDRTPPNEQEQAQYLYSPQPQPAQAQGHAARGLGSPASPQGSYYSVSELPPPSPQPSPKYKLPSGEITSTPPSRRSSIATTRASVRTVRANNNQPMPTYDMPPMSPVSPGRTLSPPVTQQHFEMNAISSRGPPSAYPAPPSSTGHGGGLGRLGGREDMDQDMDAEMDPRHQPYYYAQGYQQGELDAHGYGHGGHDHDPNQRASRASEISWDGPRAL
ncbi:P-type phospholipid transporter [Mycena venus]|uniref:Phospholipid-transporting ATPase n=1 Tax=Mycena venus TaxID=2733690 RepID=A0A8H6Z250_9AGAR|nr:P-type phospholipid transporter [Mycena venus]